MSFYFAQRLLPSSIHRIIEESENLYGIHSEDLPDGRRLITPGGLTILRSFDLGEPRQIVVFHRHFYEEPTQ